MAQIIHVDFEKRERISDASYTTDQFTCDVCDRYYEYDSRSNEQKVMRIKASLPNKRGKITICQNCIKQMHDVLFN